MKGEFQNYQKYCKRLQIDRANTYLVKVWFFKMFLTLFHLYIDATQSIYYIAVILTQYLKRPLLFDETEMAIAELVSYKT